MRFFGLFLLIYLVVGVLVASSVIGGEPDYFSSLDNLEEIAEMIIAVLLWPLVLLDVNINLGGAESGGGSSGGGADKGGSGGGGGK